MNLNYQISVQVMDELTNEPATGRTVFIAGYDGNTFWNDDLKFQERFILDEDGRIQFGYSKLFSDSKAEKNGQYLLITDIDMELFRDSEREIINIIDSLEWNTNYDNLILFG